jgi:ribose transport system substrate-binding protein
MYQKACVVLVVLLLGAGLPGCGGSGKDAESPVPVDGPPEKPRIALIMKSLANEFFLTMENGAKAHQAAHADEYDLIAQGIRDELDVSRQIQLVEQMMAQHVDAIVIAPADSKALVNVCKKAMDAGIAVVNIDNRLDEEVVKEKGVVIPFVGPDNRKGAEKVGLYLAEHLEKGDPVAIVEGAPNAYNAQQRKRGFEDAIEAGGLKLVASQAAHWEMARANQAVAAMITEHPELKGLLCANDSMALGAVAALRAAGRLGAVKVVGFDNISAVQDLLESGAILATADQHADQLAVFGIAFALEALQGGDLPPVRETPVDLVTGKAS